MLLGTLSGPTADLLCLAAFKHNQPAVICNIAILFFFIGKETWTVKLAKIKRFTFISEN